MSLIIHAFTAIFIGITLVNRVLTILARRKQRRILDARQLEHLLGTTKRIIPYAPRISSQLVLTSICLSLGVLCLIYGIHHHRSWVELIGGILYLVGSLNQVGLSRPPFVLVLARSHELPMRFQSFMRSRLTFFRSASLLQTSDHSTDMLIAGDCFRIEPASAWREAVFAFYECVPILVFDTRMPSRALFEEIDRLFDEGWDYKAAFLVSDDSDKRLTGSSFKNEEELVRFLFRVLEDWEVSPTREVPIPSLYQRFCYQEAHPKIQGRSPLRYGWAIQRLNDPMDQSALEYFRTADQLSGGLLLHVTWLFTMGRSAWCKKRLTDAVASYRRAATIEPGCAKIQSALAITLARLDKMEEALDALSKANELAPSNPWIEINLANCHAALGNRAEAEHWWAQAEKHGAERAP